MQTRSPAAKKELTRLGKLLAPVAAIPSRIRDVRRVPTELDRDFQPPIEKAARRLSGELRTLIDSVRPPVVYSPEALERIRLERERAQRYRLALGAAIADAIGQAVTKLPAGTPCDPVAAIGAALGSLANDKKSEIRKTLGRRVDAITGQARQDRAREKKR